MNEAIELLLLQIANMCLRISAKGHASASCDITDHVHTVYVTLYNAGTDFGSAAAIKAGEVLHAYAKYDHSSYDWLTPEEQQQAAEQALNGVINQLMPYLQTEQQEAA